MELVKEQEQVQEWYGLYSGGWTKNDLSPESFSHPAKISKALSEALYSYALERGWLLPGDTVLDPFAGMGGTAKAALTRGINWVGMELEIRFWDMAHGCECTGISKADWVRFYGRWDRMAYKDGRHWCPACVAAAGKIDPPKSPQLSLFDLPEEPSAAYTRNSGQIPHSQPHHYTGNLERFQRYAKGNARAVVLQGDSRYLRANLRAAGFGPLQQAQDAASTGSGCEGVVSSPPYLDWKLGSTQAENPNAAKYRQNKDQPGNNGFKDYGSTDGQLGAMPPGSFDATISSSPFAGNTGGQGEASRNGINAALFDRHQGGMKRGTGDNPRNLDHLPMRDFEGVISSPPFSPDQPCASQSRAKKDYHSFTRGDGTKRDHQMESDANLAALPPGDLDGVIGSPPYAQALGHDSGHPRLDEIEDKRRSTEGSHRRNGYGNSTGQLSSLKEGDLDAAIGSPPFAASIGSDSPEKRGGILASDPKRAGDRSLTGSYGETPGQLGGMAEGVVSSPPFENSMLDKGTSDRRGRVALARQNGISNAEYITPIDMSQKRIGLQTYGSTPGQLGAESRETFWAAARLILIESFHLLKPGAVAIWVCKCFVRDGQIVDFPGQWRQLSEACGFEFVEEVRAMQVSRPVSQRTIEGETEIIQRASKSFFRRLFEKKFPNNRIDWETVVIMRKPFN